MNKLTSLSVFFPAFNEEENVSHLLEQALKYIPTFADKYELIVVDDGSEDNTKAIAQSLAENNKHIRVISHPENLGYGAALKTGFKAAKYEWVFFTDADLQFNFAELKDFLTFTESYEAIIGFRKVRAEGFGRARNAYLFKLFINLLFRVHVKDIDCAFKLFKTKLMQSITLDSNGAFISAELLYKLKKNHVKFKQLPVTHYPRLRGNPTGAKLNVIFRAGFDALKLYFSIKLGRLKQHQW